MNDAYLTVNMHLHHVEVFKLCCKYYKFCCIE